MNNQESYFLKNFFFVSFLFAFFPLLLSSCAMSWSRSDLDIDGTDSLPEPVEDFSINEDIPLDNRNSIDTEGEEIACAPSEICNGIDDNCNGLIDEGFECFLGQVVSCTTQCGSQGQGVCGSDCRIPSGNSCTPPPERCNGIDDDCDGIRDNGFQCQRGESQTCTTACGNGTKICTENCTWGDCTGPSGECSPGDRQDCSSSLPCGVGTKTCQSNCYWGSCNQTTAAETCNGRDDDCDGYIDETVKVKLTGDIRVTNTSVSSDLPFILWTGSEYFIFWQEGIYHEQLSESEREIYAARLNASGIKIGSDIQITNTQGDHYVVNPVIAGSEIGVFWSDYRSLNGYDIYMTKLNFSGVKIVSDTLLVDSPSSGWAWIPGPVWTGSQYAVAWMDNRDEPNNEIYFGVFSSSGVPISSPVRITRNNLWDEYAVKPIWTGSNFIVTFNEYQPDGTSRCKIARFDGSGNLLSGPNTLIDESSIFCVPAWVPAENRFGVSWVTGNGSAVSDLRFAIFNSTGSLVAGPVSVYNPPSISIYPITTFHSDLNVFSISWVEAPSLDSGGECYYAEIDTGASLVTPPTQVSASGNKVYTLCTHAWTGSAYGFAWQDDRDFPTAGEVYFAIMGCR